MSETSDVSRWAGAGIALLAAGGGYIGSVTSDAESSGALQQKVATLQTAIQEHDHRERSFEESIRNQLMDIEARVRVLESRQ
jgi:Tfp pilus assembly protein PilO